MRIAFLLLPLIGIPTTRLCLAQFGPIPPDPTSMWVMDDARELILLLLVDPATITDQVPEGIHLITAAETEPSDRRLRAYLAQHPEHRDHAFTVLEIVTADSFDVDGHPLNGAFAIWLAGADPASTGEDRARGYSWIVLGWWVPDTTVSQHMRARGYGTETAEVVLRQSSPGTWQGSMTTGDLKVAATCRLEGTVEKLDYPLPIYQTLWTRGLSAREFTLLTFHNHHEQRCQGGWTLEGQGPLAEAIQYGDLTQFGFSLRGGLYERR